MPGAGKSTAGRVAAELAGMPFIDLDEEIERKAGRSIAGIFQSEGEGAFRVLETEATSRILAGEPSVIAAGGGWIASAQNRPLLLSRGRIIYLRIEADTAAARLGDSHGRPKLAGGTTIDMLRRLESDRRSLYETADAMLDTEGLELQQVATKLADLIKVLREE